MGSLTNLAFLQLFANSLIGTLPLQLSKLTKLNSLFLQQNSLSGTIPSAYGTMTKLSSLNMGDNFLNNTIPSSFLNLKSLTTLVLNSNKLRGNIENILILTNKLLLLQVIDLSYNYLTGKLSSKIGNYKVLNSLNLAFNRISGSIPNTIQLSPKLLSFNISNNNMKGSLSVSLLNYTNLVLLDVQNNTFTGKISNYLCNLTSLNIIYISNNNFSCYASCLPPPSDTYVLTNSSNKILPHCYGVQDEIICSMAKAANIHDSLQRSGTYTPIIVQNNFHPYLALTTEYTTVSVPNAVGYTVTFDSLTMTELFQDIVTFCATPACLVTFGSKSGYSGLSGSSYPGLGGTAKLVISAPQFVVRFTSNGTYAHAIRTCHL